MDDFPHHQQGVARLNHGSFGASPKVILDLQQDIRTQWLAQPDAAYFAPGEDSIRNQLKRASKPVAKYIGAKEEDVCLVENATVAASTIAQRWSWEVVEGRVPKGTCLMVLNFSYGATKHSFRAHCGRAGFKIVEAELPFPVHDVNSIISAVRDCLSTHKPQFACLDHITSQPSLVLPITELVALCREFGVKEVAIDGSHAIGSVALTDVPSIGADFYFTNLHKWAFAPHTACALWTRGTLVSSTHHAIVSWDYGEGVVTESLWTGTRDYTAFLVVPRALEFLESWRSPEGGRDVISHNKHYCWKYANDCASAWGTSVGAPREMCGSMVMLQLPVALKRLYEADSPGKPGKGLREILRTRFGIEAAVGNFGHIGAYIRLSHAVYNTAEDFKRLKDAILQLIDETKTPKL